MNSPGKLMEKLDKPLYNVASKDMYPLLQALRTLPEVKDCYTFGATLHFVTENDVSPDDAICRLRQKGVEDVRIGPAKGNIEDLFINLVNKKDE